MTPITFEQVVTEVLDAIRARKSKEQRSIVEQLINKEYFSLHRRFSWEMARETLTIDLSSADYDSGMWLPSNLAGVDMVFDSDHEVEVLRRSESESVVDEHGLRYHLKRGSKSGLFTGNDCSVVRGSTSFASTLLDAEIAGGMSVIGEYVRIGGDLGYYELDDDSPTTLETAYKYDDKAGEMFYLRPPETQKIVVTDSEEDEVLDRIVVVYYWAYPEPLSNPGDIVMLPTSDVLSLSVISKMPEAKPHRPISQSQVDNAVDDAIRLNGDFPRNKTLTGVTGKRVKWGSDFYDARTSDSARSTMRW